YDRNAFMRTCGGAKLMKKIDAASHCRREADAIVGAVDVIIHSLRNSNDRETFLVQPLSVAQSVVSTNGNQGINLEILQVLQYVRREVFRLFVVFRVPSGFSQETRHVASLHLPRIRPRGVEKSSAGTVNRSDVSAV